MKWQSNVVVFALSYRKAVLASCKCSLRFELLEDFTAQERKSAPATYQMTRRLIKLRQRRTKLASIDGRSLALEART